MILDYSNILQRYGLLIQEFNINLKASQGGLIEFTLTGAIDDRNTEALFNILDTVSRINDNDACKDLVHQCEMILNLVDQKEK